MNRIINYIKNIFKINKKNIEEEKPWIDLYGNNIPHTLDYEMGSMYDAFYKAMKKYPKYKACTYYGKTLNYTEFNAEIIKAAKALKALGMKKGDRVTICMPNTIDAITLFYAVNMTGGICNMIHPLSSEKEIEFYLSKSGSKYILCLDMMLNKVNNIIENTKVKKVIVSKITNVMPTYMRLIVPLIKKKQKVQYNKKVI